MTSAITSRKRVGIPGTLAALAAFAVLSVFLVGVALAGHNGADVSIETGDCGETTFTATITDPDVGHQSDNMRLVVHADGDTQVTDDIPTDGSEVEITVGPLFDDTIEWRVFGGGERDYDSPSWNGYGDSDFNQDVADYGDDNGFDWVIAGPDDDNPFTTWDELDVEGCPTRAACMDGGWEDLGFRNQGQCIRYVETGQDSR